MTKIIASVKRNNFEKLQLHLMVLPAFIAAFVFCYLPMPGIIMAFQEFNIGGGIFHSEFIGLDNFTYLFKIPGVGSVIWNTFYIAFMKLILGLLVSLVFAILLNEIKSKYLVKPVQTIVYIPYFISWVLMAGILIDLLSPSQGIINQIIKSFGGDPVYFLGSPKIFPYVLVITDVWKNFGFGSIVFIAALASIDPVLYEAARIDGANRWKQMLSVTLPGIAPMIAVVAVLSLGGCLNGLFDQVFNLYSPVTYETGDIIDTFVYRMGLIDMQYAVAAAFGLFKSVVSFIMVSLSYYSAYKYANYRVF